MIGLSRKITRNLCPWNQITREESKCAEKKTTKTFFAALLHFTAFLCFKQSSSLTKCNRNPYFQEDKKKTSPPLFGVNYPLAGELFAQAPVSEYPGCVVEAVTDSSRYFVIRIEDGNGKSLTSQYKSCNRLNNNILNTKLSYCSSIYLAMIYSVKLPAGIKSDLFTCCWVIDFTKKMFFFFF